MKNKPVFFLATVLLTALVFIFVSCAGNTEKEPAADDTVDPGSSVLPVVTPETEELNFYGAKLRLYSQWGDNFKASEAFSITADLQLERFKECREKYNFEFEVMNYTSDPSKYLTTALISGTDVPDIVDCAASVAYPLYKQSCFSPVENLEAIDLTTSRWGTENFRRYGKFDGVQYGLYWYDWDDPPQYAGVLLFNNELITAMNMENPYEQIENKRWTWDYFTDAVEKATVITDDFKQLGLGYVDSRFFVETVIFSNGAQIVDNSTGKYACALGKPEGVAALQYVSELNNSGYVASCVLADFTQKKYVFLSSETWQGTVMSETAKKENRPLYSMQDFGMIPFPSGPNAGANTSSSFTNCNRRMFWIIEGAENTPDDIAKMMNIVFAPLPGCNPESWRDRAESYIFIHPEGLENYINMLENCQYDYTTELYSVITNINSGFTQILGGKKTVAEALDTLTSQINAQCDTELNRTAE